MISLFNLENWQKYLFQPLVSSGHTFDVVLATYETQIVELLAQMLHAKETLLKPQVSQVENMKTVVNYMKDHKDEYDRFIILRFDILYKIMIDKWPTWNEFGLHLVNRDKHWVREHLYEDFVFLVDSPWVDLFHTAVHQLGPGRLPHDCGRYFYENDIPILLMYESFHPNHANPLHAFARDQIVDPDPSYETITDISDCIGISPLTVVSILIPSEQVFSAKQNEIQYLASQYDIVDFKCSFSEKVREIYKGKKYIFETIKVSSIEINLETYNIP